MKKVSYEETWMSFFFLGKKEIQKSNLKIKMEKGFFYTLLMPECFLFN